MCQKILIIGGRKMINFVKDDFDESIEDIMKSVNQILEKTGKGYETVEEDKKE